MERSPRGSMFSGRNCGLVEDPLWSSLFLTDCSLWERPTLEKFAKDCLPLEGPHGGAGKECEEEGAAETVYDELIATSIPHFYHLEGGGGRGVGNEAEPGMNRGMGGKISSYFLLYYYLFNGQ